MPHWSNVININKDKRMLSILYRWYYCNKDNKEMPRWYNKDKRILLILYQGYHHNKEMSRWSNKDKRMLLILYLWYYHYKEMPRWSNKDKRMLFYMSNRAQKLRWYICRGGIKLETAGKMGKQFVQFPHCWEIFSESYQIKPKSYCIY